MTLLRWQSLAVLAGLVVLSASASHAAPPLAPTKPGQLRTLVGWSSSSPCDPTQIKLDQVVNSDGSYSAFTIPEGKVLVITSADWYVVGAVPSRHYRLAVYARSDGNPPLAVVSGAGAATDAEGHASGAVVVPSGIAVKPGVALCSTVVKTNTAAPNGSVRLHGFITPDR